MDKKLQNQLQEQLVKERDRANELIQHMDEGQLDIPVQDSISELSMYDNHPADLGSETFERSKDLALREEMQIHLAKIDNALDRMAQGVYGKCDRCGEDIDVERLKAIPETTMCIQCKEMDEELPDRHPRPIEEDVIVPPFGGHTHDTDDLTLLDAKDENEFDGEDAWQSVARYGTSETPQDISVNYVNDFNDMYLDSDEAVGSVEDVEAMPYRKSKDGFIYRD